MSKILLNLEETTALIKTGKVLGLAGDEGLLDKLPKGNWIGGTVPYFMGESGGLESHDKIYVTEFNDVDPRDFKAASYDVDGMKNIAVDAPDDGFTYLILPAGSDIILEFSNNSRDYEDMFIKPIVGWISGIRLEDIGKIKPKTYNGATLEKFDNRGVAFHAALRGGKRASIKILNLFSTGTGDVITFPNTGFVVKECLINGKPRNFAEYIKEKSIDIRLPLVADYEGAMINISFQSVDEEAKTVMLYAPVFSQYEYRQAAVIGDYVKSYEVATSKLKQNPAFCCNCILNYVYGELNGKKQGGLTGPFGFGEIAYQLLNQTMVYLEIEKA